MEKTTGSKLYEHPIPSLKMKEKRNLTQIYQLNVHFPQFQGQDKDLPDAEITSILTTLTWNLYLTVFLTILQMIQKIHIRVQFNNTRKKYLYKIASEILLNGPFIGTDLIKFQYYSFILDTIDTKLYKPEQTRLNKKYLNILVQ